jgi:hypothetical protein
MKKIKYTISPPTFTEKEFIDLYNSRINYTYNKTKSNLFKNVFISNSGLIIRCYLLPFRSAENLIGNQDHTFYFKHWRKAIEQYFVCKYGNSLNSIHLEDETLYFTIHTPWFGYFSWITTCLPRLISVLEKHPDAQLIYPEEWNKFPYIKESLNQFPNLKIKIIPIDHHIFIRHFLFEPCREWTSHFDETYLLKIQSYFYSTFQLLGSKKKFKRIYISRAYSERRKVINENELELYLMSKGFEIVYMEKLTFSQQVSLMYESEIVISTHGAGLANVNFMNKDSILIELTPILSDFSNFRFPFWRMANLLGVRYHSVFCYIVNKKKEEYESDIAIDLKKLKKILDFYHLP